MKKFTKWMWTAAMVIGVYVIAHAATTYQRFVVNGNQIWLLQNDGTVTQPGSLKFGNDSVTPAMPTTTTGGLFGMKIPVTNIGAAVTQGILLCSSNTGTGYVSACATDASKSFVGIAEGAIASGAVGYASVGGYALALTSGTVAIGDVIVSSSTMATGYGATNNSPSAATNIGVAMSAGTTAGGLTLVRLK